MTKIRTCVCSTILAIAMLIVPLPTVVFADDSWNGTAKDTSWYTADTNATTYTISDAAELAGLAQLVNDGTTTFSGKTIKLGDDIDLNNKEWTPIGNSTYAFQGTFDGSKEDVEGNYTISNLYINSPSADNVGLFGYTTSGEVKNVTLNNANVTGCLDVGAVAGYPFTSKYTNIDVTGTIRITGYAYVGGALGKNAYADITDVNVTGNPGSCVTANSENYRTYVGGLVGFMGEGPHTIKDCDVEINVTGSTCDVGGLLGILHYGNTMTNCTYKGSLTLTNPDAEDGSEFGALTGTVMNSPDGPSIISDCEATVTSATSGGQNVTDTITPHGDFYDPINSSDNEEITVSITGTKVNNIPVTVDNNVAQVGDKKYKTLQAAIDAVETDNNTVNILNDVTISESLNIDEPITIEGNGHTITANKCVGIYIKDDLTSLSINNLTLEGVIDEGAKAGEGSTGSWMGIGTYNGCYGVNDLRLTNVTIDGFSYGMYFGKNPTGGTVSFNETPVIVTADNLTLQNNYIKGAYFEKLTDSSFNNCHFVNNGSEPSKVESTFQTWMCGVDLNLKNGSYQDIRFTNCEFTENGANNGTALHLKARDDGNYGDTTTLDGVIVTGCTFTNNNDTNMDSQSFGPIVIGEQGKSNKTPVNITIQPDVTYTNNLATDAVYTVTFNSNGGSSVPVMLVEADEIITLPTPTRTGYTFAGWYDSNNNRVSSPYTVTGDTTLTAQWQPPYTGKYSYEIFTKVGDNGAIDVDRYATEGDKVTITVSPDEAYMLDDMTLTSGGKDVEVKDNGDGTYTFTMPSGDVKIEVTFAEDPDWEPEPEEPAMPFNDVDENDWFYDVVLYAYENGLMTGTSADTFAPNTATTRGMIVSMLARLEGVTSAESAGFTDVADDDWYATAVNWAANEGIVNGFEDDTFRPNDVITREQMAAILYNYADYKGYDVSARADLSDYADAASISSWAEDVLAWANAEGLINGMTATTIDPQGATTRAQTAAMFERFLTAHAE